MRPESVPLLRRLARLLKGSPEQGRILLVAGHADPQGESAHNEELSQRRAETVAAFVADYGGVGKNTLVAEGRGEREPIVPATAPVDQQRFNRRVEISVRCPGGGP
ncbi:MAG: OmpA family protein [Deltaproteobacteria bacterium]|nr:OmpA family protein [Deltaproteobacteria bacterium]